MHFVLQCGTSDTEYFYCLSTARRLVSYGADELEESSSSSEEDDTQSSDKHGSFVIEVRN